MGPGLTIESDLSIADFPTVGSCLLDLPQPPAGFNNRFQVIAANIDSWRTKLVAKLKLYRSIIADLMTMPNPYLTPATLMHAQLPPLQKGWMYLLNVSTS